MWVFSVLHHLLKQFLNRLDSGLGLAVRLWMVRRRRDVLKVILLGEALELRVIEW